MPEELLSVNMNTIITLTCIIVILYCVIDIAMKIGQATGLKKVQKQVNEHVSRPTLQDLPYKPVESIIEEPEESDEQRLERLLSLGSNGKKKPELVATHKPLKYNSPIKQVQDLMKPRPANKEPEKKNERKDGLESF